MLIKFFGYTSAILVIAATIVSLKIAVYFFQITPEAMALTTRVIPESSVIYDRTGKHVLYEIHGDENRKVLSHAEIPDVIRVATVAIEDDDFYHHDGFDLAAIARATLVNIQTRSIRQGGSTITQQLARNAFLTKERTFERKLKELALAIKIEKTFSKDQILDQYLNEVSYGSNIHGVQTAAENYFRKDAKDLTLAEAAFLASLTKAPSYFSPYGSNRPELEERQEYVLGRIKELGLATPEEVEAALNAPVAIHSPSSPIKEPHFVFFVIEQLEQKYGQELVEQGGLRIITTLDLELQEIGKEAVKNGAQKNLAFGSENAALVAIDPKNGEILTMIGSKDFYDQTIDGQVNVANRPRQPGSAFKPIVYAKAFEKGYQPETLLYDVRTDFGPDGSGRNYVPDNYSGNFTGLVSMRQAIAMSLNIPAVKTLYLAGVEESVQFAKRLGIDSLTGTYGLSLVLGGGDITLLEGTAAYSVFANDGIRAPATPIVKITDRDDNELDFNSKRPARVIDQEVARKINSVLSDNEARTPTFGPNSSLHIPGRTVAAKTGTTQSYRDAWAIGFTPNLAVGVWAGNNDNSPMRAGAAGTFVAAPIWNEFMVRALDRYPEEYFAVYRKVESSNMMVTGKLERSVTFYNRKSGQKLSDEKRDKTNPDKIEQRQVTSRHSILYYVDKDNPLSPGGPDRSDPMLRRWEQALSG